MCENKDEVLQVEAYEMLQYQDGIEGAQVDVQVVTAKRFPRNISRSRDNLVALVQSDYETAKKCSYALPRGGKPLTGPSVHLARMAAQTYGNLRAEAKVVQITDKQVVSRGMAWDLETNFAVAFEVRRSIVNREGVRFSDDMITVTGNAANAIAFRNSVLSVIPKSITDAAYLAAQGVITGDVSDEAKLTARVKKAVDHFYDTYAITEEEILKLLGIQTTKQITPERIALLVGYSNSLKDGDTTVELLLKDIRSYADKVEAKKANMKKQEDML